MVYKFIIILSTFGIHIHREKTYPFSKHLGAQAVAVQHAALGIEAVVAVPPWTTELGFIQVEVWD